MSKVKITIFGMASGDKIWTTDYLEDAYSGDYYVKNIVESPTTSFREEGSLIPEHRGLRVIEEGKDLVLRGNLVESIEKVYREEEENV